VGHYREILLVLVERDLKARSKQAFLGYLWVLIQPLLLTGVFTFLVQRVLQRGDAGSVPYPVFLMAALIPWQFFATSLNESAESLVKNVDLVRQVYFPREILAIYPIFARLVDVAIASLALGALMLVFGVRLSGWAVLAPVLIAVEMLFCAAVGLLLAAANVAWRDVSRALPLVLFLLLYAMPVLYTADQVPDSLRWVVMLNPLARLIDDFRGAVLGTHPPDLIALAVVALVGVVLLVAAQRLFSVFDGVLADVV
jgi:lipopolysaccharide transport system permease protein